MTATILVFLLFLVAILGAPLFTILLAVAMLGFHSTGIDLAAGCQTLDGASSLGEVAGVDDPVGAISVHGVVGMWGLIAVPVTNTDASFGAQFIGLGHDQEVVGLAAVAGNGQSELAEVITGLRECTGSIEVNGKELANHPVSEAIDAGVAHVPEDRTGTGSAPTPAAPTVWAIVFRLRIAASGRSMCVFSRCSRRPVAGRSCCNRATCEGVTLSSTASRIEQRNETPRAMVM